MLEYAAYLGLGTHTPANLHAFSYSDPPCTPSPLHLSTVARGGFPAWFDPALLFFVCLLGGVCRGGWRVVWGKVGRAGGRE